jgi:hypothetical protein
VGNVDTDQVSAAAAAEDKDDDIATLLSVSQLTLASTSHLRHVPQVAVMKVLDE